MSFLVRHCNVCKYIQLFVIHVDLSETFLQTRLNKDVKLSDDIVGFSSSDDDGEQKPSSKSAVKNYLPKAKR